MSGIRAQQRVATQRNILATARRLFLAGSYESVGVRDIAAEAGVATGTVIAAFGSKVDLLHEIVIEDMGEQLELMKIAADQGSTTFERISNFCLACLNFQASRLAIVRASMADAWTRNDEAENKIRDAFRPLHKFVISELEMGIAKGELRSNLQVKLAALLILETLINTYRIPLYEDTRSKTMTDIMRERIDIVLTGMTSPDRASASGQPPLQNMQAIQAA